MDYELKYYYLHVILVIALALVVISSANARNPISIQPFLGAEEQDSVRKMNEVTITFKQPAKTIATSQTLSGADLQALSNTSVADALKYFAGVQIKDYGGLGKYSLSCMESVSLYNANKLDNCQSANVHFSPSPIASENPFSILR